MHSAEPHNLYCLQRIVRLIKSGRIGWKDHVARMGGMRNAYTNVVAKPKGGDHLEDLSVVVKVMLE